MNQLVKTKWVGHVTSLDGLTVSEHEFESPKGDNAQALTTLLLRAGLKGTYEARSIRMLEEGATKPRVYGKLDMTGDVSAALKVTGSRDDYKRFKVTLLPTAMSVHVTQRSLCAENVFEALRSVLALYKVQTTEQAGAFVVEGQSDSGVLMVEMQKNRHLLEKAGYSFSGVTRLIVPKPAATPLAIGTPARIPNWTYNHEGSATTPPTTRAEQSISAVLSILKQHAPVTKKIYNVKKD